MDLIINHRKIVTPLHEIFEKVHRETGLLNIIKDMRGNIMCQCPFHANGHEKTPACHVVSAFDTGDVYGTFHCFACGEKGPLSKFIAHCYGFDSYKQGEQWLIENYGDTFVEDDVYLPEIDLNAITSTPSLPETSLNCFEYDRPEALNYLINKRHIKKEVIDYFKLGYNVQTNSITFPCWNEHDKLVGVFERNILTKRFKIPEIYPKPVYLLNEAIKQGYTTIYLAESQINALTLYSWGFPAVALFGTGSKEQYEILRKSGIRNYILCFDGDNAGKNGREKFIKNMRKDSVIIYKQLPDGYDVNDLTYDQFMSLPSYNA